MAMLIEHKLPADTAAPAGEVPPFHEYPLLMIHPGYSPAHVGQPVRDGMGKITHHVGGTSIRFPPVQVKSDNDREYYVSLGYVPSGKGDPAAWVAAHTNPIDINGYVPQQYPKWVIDREVNSAEEEAAVRARHVPGAPVAAEPEHVAYVPEAGPVNDPSPTMSDPRVASAVVQDTRIDALESKVDGLLDMMGKFLAAQQAPAAPPKAAGTNPTNDNRGKKAWETRQKNAAAKAQSEAPPADDQAA